MNENNLVEILNDEVVTTSRQVAEAFGKRHKHVLDAIKNLVAENSSTKKLFIEDTFENRGKQYPMYIMNRDGFTLLAMGFTGNKALEFKMKYIEAFNQMEAELKNRHNKFSDFASLPLDQQLLQIAGAQSQRLDAIETRVDDIEKNRRIDSDEYKSIACATAQKVAQTVKVRGWDYNRVSKPLFKELNGAVKRVFNAANRGMLRAKDYQEVLDFINDWEPSTETTYKIKQMSLFE